MTEMVRGINEYNEKINNFKVNLNLSDQAMKIVERNDIIALGDLE